MVAKKVEWEGEQLHTISPEQVVVREDRQRQTFPKKDIDRLVTSLNMVGQLQPGVCVKNEEGQVELRIGEKRLRACAIAGIPFSYVLKDEVTSPFRRQLIELEENLARSSLTWQEEVKAKAAVHKAFQTEYGATSPGTRGGHGLKDTADYLGDSKTVLSDDIKLAAWLEIPDVAAAPNKATAWKIIERLQSMVQREKDLGQALDEQRKEAELISLNPEAQRAVIEGSALKPELAAKTAPVLGPEITAFQAKLLEWDRRCLLGKMQDRIQDFKDETFHIVIFDPPWGVEYDKVKMAVAGTKDYSDSLEAFKRDLIGWLQLIYQKMAPDSHLYLVFAIVHFEFVYQSLEAAGFTVNRMPLIWWKRGARRTRNPKVWHARSYEPVAFARKGSKDIVSPGPDLIDTPMPTPSIKDIHPSAKHPELYRQLLIRSANPGDKVLDPMAGSGMVGVAAEFLHDRVALDWWQIEMDGDYRNLELHNLNRGFLDIIGEKEAAGVEAGAEAETEPERAEYRPDFQALSTPDDFHSIEPGTPEWARYWKAHPERHDEMLAWREKKRGG